MSLYTGTALGVNPAVGVANWVLETVAGVSGWVKEGWWGGEVTTSTAMRNRLARDSAVGTGARTAGSVQKRDTHSPANGLFFSASSANPQVTPYASTAPTIIAGALWGTSWNAHGGVVRWLGDPTEWFLMYDAQSGAIGNASIECRQDTGTAAASFGVIWEEQ